MASTYSTDLSLELVATGEKAGLWGAITNTNLQLLQTAASGYVEVTLSTGTTTLSLADGSSTANGKNLYIKLTGTLSGNCNLEMPASAAGTFELTVNLNNTSLTDIRVMWWDGAAWVDYTSSFAIAANGVPFTFGDILAGGAAYTLTFSEIALGALPDGLYRVEAVPVGVNTSLGASVTVTYGSEDFTFTAEF